MGFGGLYTSISGLQASRHSLNTVGHNISNANSPNYVRQSAIHTNTTYRKTGQEGIEIGTGVKIIQVRQIRDEFLDKQVRRELPSFGYFYAKSETLEDVEAVFVEAVFNEITNSGLQNVMKDFWNAWDELGKEPESLTIRGVVHESAVAFAETVNHISDQLDYIQQDLNKQVLKKVGEVNNLLEGIAGINRKIKAVEGNDNKMKANDLRDDRNAMIDRISELLPVDTYENSFGETIVSLQGQDLVNGSHVSKIEARPKIDDKTGLSFIYFENSNQPIDLRQKGELAGVIDVRDNSVKEYKDRLDTLVGEMAEKINEVHQKGTGIGEDAVAGVDFFTVLEGVEGEDGKMRYPGAAGSIKVNPELADLNKIAASASGEIGDGEIAKEIKEIRDTLKILKYGATINDDTKNLNIDEYYNDLVTSLALERGEAKSKVDNQGFLIRSIDERRKGLSSVSLDEEMADMIKFQHAYSANSRVINTLDEMIDTIVNRLGVVGR